MQEELNNFKRNEDEHGVVIRNKEQLVAKVIHKSNI
jgi:hypothetical protein